MINHALLAVFGLGQNTGYINNSENGKAYSSLAGSFYICEYLKITPVELFDTGKKSPVRLKALMEDLQRLDDRQLQTISDLVKDMIRR